MKTDISRTGSSLPPDRSSITSELSDYSSSSSSLDYKQPSSSLNTLNTALNTEKQACPVNTHVQIDNSNGPIQIGDINRITNIIFPPLDPELKEVIKKEASGSLETQYKSSGFKRVLCQKTTKFGVLLSVIILLAVSAVAVYLSEDVPIRVLPIPTGHDDDLGDGIQIIRKEEWLGRPPINETKYLSPPNMIVIRHTAGSFCTDYQTCAGNVLALQSWQVGTLGYEDIAYNYLMGGDGNVYVGRGPDVQPRWKSNTSMQMVYIGNFVGPYDTMSDKMEEAGKRLIEKLEKEGKITKDYIIVAHNQTYNTQSPGDNIYKKIKNWPHYDSGIYFD